ncbi:unnamed protein product [Diamesa hyperborea]
MYTQFIILSLCLKVTYTLKNTTKDVPLADISKIYNAFANIKLADDVLKLVDNKKEQKVTDLIESFKNQEQSTIFDFSEEDVISNKILNQTEDVKQVAFEFSDRIEQIQDSRAEARITILSEIKASPIHECISEININCEDFALKLKFYKDNNKYMRKYIETLIGEYELNAPETTLIIHLDHDSFSSSPINFNIQLLRSIGYYQTYNMRTSTNKYIYDYYVSIMLIVGKSHGLRELLQILEDHYAEVRFQADWDYLNLIKRSNSKRLLKSWKAASDMTNLNKDFISYSNLKSNVSHVFFEKALQTFMLSEKDAKTSCRGSCKDSIKMRFNFDGVCHGRVYNCYDALGALGKGVVVYSRNTSRIYERYSLGDTWYGKHGYYDYDYTAPMYTGFEGVWECEHCRCICDQIHHVNNVNLFYVGKIEAEQEGHVITGVRFAKFNKTIYLEIESGKLLSMGLINASTLSWNGPPKDVNTNVARFDFVNRAFHLDRVFIKEGFLSGFQLFQSRRSLRLRVFSKSFQNFVKGRISDKEEIHYDNRIQNKKRLYFQDKIPLISKRPGTVSTKWNYDIFFGTSNQETDAGQTMLPFFDSTNITFDEKAPLGGIGFFHHTSSSDYAGYIRPFIYSLNYFRIIEKYF